MDPAIILFEDISDAGSLTLLAVDHHIAAGCLLFSPPPFAPGIEGAVGSGPRLFLRARSSCTQGGGSQTPSSQLVASQPEVAGFIYSPGTLHRSLLLLMTPRGLPGGRGGLFICLRLHPLVKSAKEGPGRGCNSTL